MTDAAPVGIEWDLADRLHKALRHANVSVNEMATELGVHRNTVSAYLNGVRTPKRAYLAVWAMRTGVPIGWLEHGFDASGWPSGIPGQRSLFELLAA